MVGLSSLNEEKENNQHSSAVLKERFDEKSFEYQLTYPLSSQIAEIASFSKASGTLY